ncbi:MAG: hypothetical protein K2N29_07860, partial [Ruminiclostridium sp.]|nr:hypothetical protein [Ruminiclostridium sp.]
MQYLLNGEEADESTLLTDGDIIAYAGEYVEEANAAETNPAQNENETKATGGEAGAANAAATAAGTVIASNAIPFDRTGGGIRLTLNGEEVTLA